MTTGKKLFNKIFISLLFACIITCSAAAGVSMIRADGNLSVSLSGEISGEYKRNTYFKIPSVISPSGISARLIYPDGKEFTGKEALLSKEGKYVLRYESASDFKEYEFNVINGMESLFSYSDKISAEVSELPAYIEKEGEKPYSTIRSGGVKFTMNGNDNVVKYNGVIDLNSLAGAANNPKSAFVDFAITPETNSVKEISKFRIVLTDIYDEENYVSIDVVAGDTQYTYKHCVYVKTSAKDMYASLGMSGGNYVTYGQTFRSSVYGYVPGYEQGSLKLFFDNKELILSASPNGANLAGATVFDAYGKASVVGEDNVWNGFTTGEVYLRFEFPEISGETASFTVLGIGGNDLSTDYAAPADTEIAVMNGDFDLATDYVIVGENNYFPVFEAIGYSENYGIIGSASAKVYLDDGAGVKSVAVVDGKFNVSKEGRYIVSYTLGTKQGNAGKEIAINAYNEYKPGEELAYAFSDDIPDTARVGDEIVIYNGKTSGGKGKTTVEYSVVANGTEIEAGDKGLNKSFFANTPGTYIITATVKDSVGGLVVVTKEVTVGYDQSPIIGNPVLLERYMTGKTYVFDIPECLSITETGEKKSEVRLFINNEDYTLKPYTVSGDFVLTYKAYADGAEISAKSFEIKAAEATEGEHFIESYFLAEGYTAQASESYITFFASENPERVAMIPMTAANGFNIAFAPHGAIDFEAIEFTIFDSRNKKDRVVVEYKYVNMGNSVVAAVYINGKKGSSYTESVNAESPAVSYLLLNTDGTLTNDANAFLGKITHYADGREYDGFSSGALFLEVRLKKAGENAAFDLVSVGDQILSSLIVSDVYGPKITVNNDMSFGSYAAKGSGINLVPATVLDFFGQTASVTLKVFDPDDEMVYDDNADRNKTVELNKVGIWTVTYTAKDMSGNTSESSFYINVKDAKKPEISLVNIVNSASSGEKYTFAEAIVECGNAYTLTVFAVSPDGTKIVPDSNGEVVFDKCGVYTVYYFVYDSESNYVLTSYRLLVKGGEKA